MKAGVEVQKHPVWCEYSNEPYDIVFKRYEGYPLSVMAILKQPFYLLVITLAGWLNRGQRAVMDYLFDENRIMRDQLEKRRLRFADEQRMRLAVNAGSPSTGLQLELAD